MKQGFKRIIFLNKYKSEITALTKRNNLNYMIDQTFKNINRLLVQSFKISSNAPAIHCFVKYYMSFLEIKSF